MLPRNTKNTWVSVYKSPNFITDFDRVDAFTPLCIQQDQLFLCIYTDCKCNFVFQFDSLVCASACWGILSFSSLDCPVLASRHEWYARSLLCNSSLHSSNNLISEGKTNCKGVVNAKNFVAPNYNFYSSMHEINMCPIVKFVCMYTTHHTKCLLCLWVVHISIWLDHSS